MPGDQRSAMQRLFEAQTRLASPGTTAAEIQALLEQAALAEQQSAQAPMQSAVADLRGARPGIVPGTVVPQTTPAQAGQPSLLDRAGARVQQMIQQAPDVAASIARGEVPVPSPGPAAPVQGGGPPLRDTPVASQDAHALERFATPNQLGSSVQAAQEAVPHQTGVDMASGMFVIQGAGGQIALPLGLSPTDAWSRLAGMSNQWQGTDTFGANPQISPQAAHRAWQAYIAANTALQGQGAPTGPLTEQSLAFQQDIQAPVSPENAARLAAAQAAERQAQAGADQAALDEVAARGDAFGQRGALATRQADEMDQQEQAFQTELRSRMGQFESAIQEVQNRRIDPNRYFGPGAGGRIGAALAVALGEIGAGLTGRPNAALGIIDAAINRDLQAQQADNENARAAANMRSTAIQQMRSIIGDERGAQAAVRAAHYQAFMNQIDQQLTTASGANLAALQTLRAAVLERIQAEAAVAADRARFSARLQSQTTTRGRGGAGTAGVLREAAAAVAAQDARRSPAQPQAASTPAQAPQQLPTAMERVQQGDLFQDEGQIEIAPGIFIPGIGARPTASAQMAVDAARARLARNPNDRGAREVVTAARREARARGRRIERQVRAQLPRIAPFDPDELRHVDAMAQRHARYGAESGVIAPPTPPAGTTYDGSPDAPRRYATMWASSEGARNQLNGDLMAAQFLNRVYPRIVGGMEEFGAEVTATEPMVAFARQAANEYRDMLIRARSGAAITEDELDMYMAQMPDPNEITLQNVLGILPDLRNRWEAIRSVHGERLRALLSNWGLTTDNIAGGGQRRAGQVERLRREATGPLPPEQSQSIQTYTPGPQDPSILGSGF